MLWVESAAVGSFRACQAGKEVGVLRPTRAAAIVRRCTAADIRGIRFASLRNSRTCDITLWNVPEPELRKARPCRWHRKRSSCAESHFGGAAAYMPANTPIFIRQDEHEV